VTKRAAAAAALEYSLLTSGVKPCSYAANDLFSLIDQFKDDPQAGSLPIQTAMEKVFSDQCELAAAEDQTAVPAI
jgi:hypothetical protein